MTGWGCKSLFLFSMIFGWCAGSCRGNDVQAICVGKNSCEEYYKLSKAQLRTDEGICKTFGWTWTSDPCSREGAVGFCKTDRDIGWEIEVYYSGTVDDCQANCEAEDGKFTTEEP